ncbi:MAG: 8-oxo-dGTP diphosphatase [Micromonosporaceae bacterium]
MLTGTVQERRIAAYGLCRDARDRVLLVRAAVHDDFPRYWGLPGGGVEHGEAPRDAVVREFAEETGFSVKVITLRAVISDLGHVRRKNKVVHTDRVIYDVRITGGTLRNETDGTSDLAEWHGPDELPGLILLPYVSQVLELPVTYREDIPPATPVTVPEVTHVQRFAAYGLVTDPAHRVLLTRIANGYPGAGTWHLPGGGTDFGEQATAGLLREIAEETDQRGRVTGLLDVTHLHRPGALGPEGYPIDWHTVRSLYRVVVDEPSVPVVNEHGGSTAEAQWFPRAELARLRLNGLARDVINRYGA